MRATAPAVSSTPAGPSTPAPAVPVWPPPLLAIAPHAPRRRRRPATVRRTASGPQEPAVRSVWQCDSRTTERKAPHNRCVRRANGLLLAGGPGGAGEVDGPLDHVAAQVGQAHAPGTGV